MGGSEKQELFANARTLLMPITWNEPFGMVMVEALACGTPVIAFPQGAAREIVLHELNGYLVSDEESIQQPAGSLSRPGSVPTSSPTGMCRSIGALLVPDRWSHSVDVPMEKAGVIRQNISGNSYSKDRNGSRTGGLHRFGRERRNVDR
ncbi:MAG: glycosyltransferase [Propionibacteriaceae bacterium]